jgi:hypothetical protein
MKTVPAMNTLIYLYCREKKGIRLDECIQNYLRYSIAKCINNKKKEENPNSVQSSEDIRS